MTHLDPAHLVDLLESRGTSAAAAHVDRCEHCRSQLASLRATIEVISTDDIPDPSPVYWDHFASRVNERIDAPVSGWTAWTRRPAFAAALACASVLLVLFLGARAFQITHVGGGIPSPATTGQQPDRQSTSVQSVAADEGHD
jgi:hypothetical protein